MTSYLNLLRQILDTGAQRPDRTGTGTLSVFGAQMRFDLNEGFPLVTTRKIAFQTCVHELLWFLSGSTNVRPLQAAGVHIWDKWADADGDLGPIYGKQWRDPDQIAEVIERIRSMPHSRRHIVSAWNVRDLPNEARSPQANVAQGRMALAPCHTMFQFYVANDRLSCQLYQRSADMPVGVPYNVAQYALLTMMIAQQCEMGLGEFIWTGGDCHIYMDQVGLVREQLARYPYPLPGVKIHCARSIDDYKASDFILMGYQHHDAIRYPVAV